MISVIRGGMTAALQDLDVTTNNIANASTTGFKKREASFADMYNSTSAMGVGSHVGGGVLTTEMRVMNSQGNLRQTGDVLDLAVEGQGLFAVRDATQPNQTFYTRDGSFSVDSAGEIATNEGFKVLSAAGIPITVPARAAGFVMQDGSSVSVDLALTNVAIQPNGQVAATYGTDTVVNVGKVGLATFVDPNRLTPIGANLFRENAQSGVGDLGAALVDGRGKVHSGALEMSNTDMTSEMAKLIRAQQAFSGTSRMLQAESEMVKKFV